MLDLLDRNMDPDYSDVEKLKNAPTVSDDVEGMFGTVGHILHLPVASLQAAFGVGMAKRMHCLQSPEEIAKRLRTAETKKRKHAGNHTA